jgi:enoyl-CoA hydratase/carnithine racemase
MSLVEEVPHHGWVELILNRAERRNAVSQALADELVDALARAQSSCHGAVISARGPVFCAGADLKEGISLDPDRPSARVIRAMNDSSLFLIAAVTGGVYGAGISLVAACPVAIGTDDAVFGLPEARRGMFPLGVVPYLEGRLPARRLVGLGMRSGVIDAAEAYAVGLLSELTVNDGVPRRVQTWMDLVISQPVVAAQAKRWWSQPLLDDNFQHRVATLESIAAGTLPAPQEALQ